MKTTTQAVFAPLIREYLFPAGCAVCKKMLIGKEEAWYGLCGDCGKTFSIERGERCSLCGKPLVSETGICMRCRETAPPDPSGAVKQEEDTRRYFDRVLPLFPYTGTYRTLLSAYKFKKHRSTGNFFTEQLLEGLDFFLNELTHPVLVPVPPRPGKIKREGWDQIEYLACLLEKEYRKDKRFPVRRCLVRLPSQSQKELGRLARQRNLLHRIRCVREAPGEAILFDDVYTTGATINACAAALKEAGTKRVYGICLFYD